MHRTLSDFLLALPEARARRHSRLGPFVAGCSMLAATFLLPFGGPAGASQVGSLTAQAKEIAQELVEQQLQAGAYQQQYSLATSKVEEDEQAIDATRLAITADRAKVAARDRDVRHLALLDYVLNGSTEATSGASLFAENVDTVTSANEYAIVSIGNLNAALAQLRTAQQAAAAQQVALEQQQTADQAEQAREASYLSQANATSAHLQSVQAQVKGQLATAVAEANAAEAASAARAVATAQRATVTQTVAYVPTGAVDPALNSYLQCVRQAESGGNYGAVSPNGEYMGAFQFSQPTWNSAAQAAGLPSLVGVPPNEASRADQDTLAVTLYSLDGDRPWLGDRCT